MSRTQNKNDSAVLAALANDRRRVLLRYLKRMGGAIAVTEAAEHILEADRCATKSRKDIVLELYHIHLPKLDEVDLIEYDSDQQLVESGSELQSALEILRYVG